MVLKYKNRWQCVGILVAAVAIATAAMVATVVLGNGGGSGSAGGGSSGRDTAVAGQARTKTTRRRITPSVA